VKGNQAKEKADDRLARTACSPSSDTPETDEAVIPTTSGGHVPAHLARKLERQRNEWKAALLRIHPTGRGTPDEMATDIIEGIEAAKVAIALLSENEKSPDAGAKE
jgi:hypothetical protein